MESETGAMKEAHEVSRGACVDGRSIGSVSIMSSARPGKTAASA